MLGIFPIILLLGIALYILRGSQKLHVYLYASGAAHFEVLATDRHRRSIQIF
jgi:hypothetical protein